MFATRCPTAPGKVFGSEEEYKAHYRSDWHRYNLRRKIAGLEMVTEEEFDAKREAAAASQGTEARQSYSHVKPSKREAQRKRLERRGATSSGATIKDSVAAYRSSREVSLAPEEAASESGDEPIVTAEVRATDSLFDSRRFDDVAEALAYMQRRFGFFLPEVEYLVDLEGCVTYLCDKIKQRRTCLYCGRVFRSFSACQQHSLDKSHCKVAYETDDQIAELADFYDFSRSYDLYDDVDDVLDLDDDDEGWETDDDDESPDDDRVESPDDDRLEPNERPARRPVPRVRVLESGELLLHHGNRHKIVGARWLRRYYKQNYRLDDSRSSTLAVRSEQTARVLALYQDAGLLAKADGFFARGLAAQFNKRALAGVAARDLRAQVRHRQMNMGMHAGRAKNSKANKLIKHQTAGRNRGEGTGVHG